MRRIQDGESAAFDELYRDQRETVYNVGLKVLGDWALAEDLTQTVFMKVWTRPAAFQGGSFDAWIARVARNAAIDHVRHNGRTALVELFVDPEDEVQLLDLIVARLDGERLNRLLRSLSNTHRSVIESNFLKGQSHEEIAAATGIPLGTVKTRIRAGLEHLRNAFAATDRSGAEAG